MTFFSSFSSVEYKFGDEDTPDLFRNLSVYATVIDQIKNENSLYEDYQVIENQRPDSGNSRSPNKSNNYFQNIQNSKETKEFSSHSS